jgi:peptidoglycan hydrolase-like protein with peptidoglycan-binding domain
MRRLTHLLATASLIVGTGVFVAATPAQTQPQTKSKAASTSSRTRKISKKTSRKKDKGQKTPTSDRIMEIQQALAKDGSYSAAPSGKWDDDTVEAMKKFQTAHALNPSGKLDARTLEKLGLGSTTAGVAEPVAPPNSTSRLTGGSIQSSRQ